MHLIEEVAAALQVPASAIVKTLLMVDEAGTALARRCAATTP
jgi:prolyl-tRNA editing enzyme YbaK/EbsC (Cys-tRNA(Pro) deacylase)